MDGGHLHQVRQRGTYYGAPDNEFGMDIVSERRTRISDLLVHPKDRFVYEYDFGDGWEHDVVLEKLAEPDPRLRYPRVIAGKRACPPEDVGGPPGYADFLKAVTNSGHEEHASMLEWIGRPFDPQEFDLILVNDGLPRKRPAKRRDD